jgi:hypothetical protein
LSASPVAFGPITVYLKGANWTVKTVWIIRTEHIFQRGNPHIGRGVTGDLVLGQESRKKLERDIAVTLKGYVSG